MAIIKVKEGVAKNKAKGQWGFSVKDSFGNVYALNFSSRGLTLPDENAVGMDSDPRITVEFEQPKYKQPIIEGKKENPQKVIKSKTMTYEEIKAKNKSWQVKYINKKGENPARFEEDRIKQILFLQG